MPTTTPKRLPTAQHTAQLLAIAPRVLVSIRKAYSLSSSCLSILYAYAALQVDKTGRVTVAQVRTLTGLRERDSYAQNKKLAALGYVQRVGGHTTWQLQTWSLTASGWALVKDASQRVASLLSPLLIEP